MTNGLKRQIKSFKGHLSNKWNMCVPAQQGRLVMGAMQAISSDDICLRPHSAVAARTPSRRDSAADATLDKAIAPVLKKQQAVPETLPWSVMLFRLQRFSRALVSQLFALVMKQQKAVPETHVIC